MNHRWENVEVKLWLEHESNLSAPQLKRALVIEDPQFAGIYAIRVPPHGRQQKPIDLLVHGDREYDKWDMEEVTFSQWPPKTMKF